MQTSNQHFGLLIAYLLPGFIGLAGVALVAPTVSGWLQPKATDAGLGPPVYAVLAAIAIGMITSCVRWLVIDHIFAWIGITAPNWDARALDSRLPTFTYLVESHYRYYQFYANSLVAIAFSYSLNRWLAISPLVGVASDLAVAVLCFVLLAGARDSLIKYYERTTRLVAASPSLTDRGAPMTNGCHRDHAAPPTSHVKPTQPKAPPKQPMKGAPARARQAASSQRQQ